MLMCCAEQAHSRRDGTVLWCSISVLAKDGVYGSADRRIDDACVCVCVCVCVCGKNHARLWPGVHGFSIHMSYSGAKQFSCKEEDCHACVTPLPVLQRLG